MKYMLMFLSSTQPGEPDPSAVQAMYEQVGRWWGEHSAAGRIKDGHQLAPAASATTVRFDNGRPVLSDGPFVEAKETVGGYALVDVPDLDAALQMARTWPAGNVEIRPVLEMG